MIRLFASGGPSIGALASASVFPMNIQGWFPLGLTGLISLQSKGLSRVFYRTQFKSINFLELNLLCGPTLISIHDYWKNHNFDYANLYWQDDVSALAYAIRVGHSFLSKEQVSFNFMTAVSICSDLGAQVNKICHCFLFPLLFAMKWWDCMPQS